ncbi:O-antigen ligase family protein [Roseomonas sp. AR75]|uniref:O-antigen ligase family protein n=1 Tax=Roseomonas sp. AR75 TaxID=2562311 RepID=UPI0010C101D9|nr:O-antigen ligase family protein [Roseomonas sp. AR75]
MIPAPRHALALVAGWLAATLQLAGALKTAPPFAALPFDLSLAAFALLLPLLAVLATTARWRLDPVLALPLAAALLLPLWLVIAGSWTASRLVAADKLPEVVLAGPAMLAIGMLVGAEPAARRALAAASLLIGVVLAAVILWRFAGGWRAALDPEAGKVHHQLAGLALAIAAGLAAVRAAESRGALPALGWLLLVGALAVAALLPGGRTALLALGLGVALAPALRLGLDGRRGAAAAWLAACVAAGLLFLLLLLLRPQEAEGLRTLERLTGEAAGLEARLGLWQAALDWAGRAAPFGLGTGGFTIAAGHGERRGLYPHNHALEALAEAGLPGLLLWLGAFAGGLVAAIRLLRHNAPPRAARIAAMVLPVALTVMVSTDLGNRMAWFALGLALSLGVASAPARASVPRHV